MGKSLGTKAGSMISNLFEIEMEGLSPEDQEFEVAKRVVRFGDAATRNTLKLAQRMPLDQATQIGFKQAAASHAPGMLKQIPVRDHRTGTGVKPSHGRGGPITASGRWVRKGNRINIECHSQGCCKSEQQNGGQCRQLPCGKSNTHTTNAPEKSSC